MDEAGVKVTAVRYNGMIHDWGLLNALANEAATKASIQQAGIAIKNALQ
ncbi:hypothetical protein KTO58_25565 [Chitinophaga pendula]|nr:MULTISPECIES: hypothetical protein [Chitinophaga]UCJ06995.1 hypothetical protein KTO58_25565 [Chitinophaga pendula]